MLAPGCFGVWVCLGFAFWVFFLGGGGGGGVFWRVGGCVVGLLGGGPLLPDRPGIDVTAMTTGFRLRRVSPRLESAPCDGRGNLVSCPRPSHASNPPASWRPHCHRRRADRMRRACFSSQTPSPRTPGFSGGGFSFFSFFWMASELSGRGDSWPRPLKLTGGGFRNTPERPLRPPARMDGSAREGKSSSMA